MNIREAIKRLADNSDEIYLKIGKVTTVDTKRRTCDVIPLDGSAPLPDVKLQAGESGANALIAWPRIGSYVLVGFLTPDAGCVLLTHDPERIQATVGDNTLDLDAEHLEVTIGKPNSSSDSPKAETTDNKPTEPTNSTLLLKTDGITINGGKLGGLVNINDLKANLDSLKKYCEALTEAVESGLNKVGAGAAANGPAASGLFKTTMAKESISIQAMEDTKVKH